MNEKNELYTIEELSELLKVSTRTIRRLIRRRELPVIRIGRQLRFSRKAVNAWLESNTQNKDVCEGDNSA